MVSFSFHVRRTENSCSVVASCSLRVNLDMGKMVFSWMIKKDSKIPGTMVRASTIPEQLGRISYLLTDKTGWAAGNGISMY